MPMRHKNGDHFVMRGLSEEAILKFVFSFIDEAGETSDLWPQFHHRFHIDDSDCETSNTFVFVAFTDGAVPYCSRDLVDPSKLFLYADGVEDDRLCCMVVVVRAYGLYQPKRQVDIFGEFDVERINENTKAILWEEQRRQWMRSEIPGELFADWMQQSLQNRRNPDIAIAALDIGEGEVLTRIGSFLPPANSSFYVESWLESIPGKCVGRFGDSPIGLLCEHMRSIFLEAMHHHGQGNFYVDDLAYWFDHPDLTPMKFSAIKRFFHISDVVVARAASDRIFRQAAASPSSSWLLTHSLACHEFFLRVAERIAVKLYKPTVGTLKRGSEVYSSGKNADYFDMRLAEATTDNLTRAAEYIHGFVCNFKRERDGDDLGLMMEFLDLVSWKGRLDAMIPFLEFWHVLASDTREERHEFFRELDRSLRQRGDKFFNLPDNQCFVDAFQLDKLKLSRKVTLGFLQVFEAQCEQLGAARVVRRIQMFKTKEGCCTPYHVHVLHSLYGAQTRRGGRTL